ncbi:MAG: PQQ-binding-like beta-propeller repeat protein [Chryseolinea sp.]
MNLSFSEGRGGGKLLLIFFILTINFGIYHASYAQANPAGNWSVKLKGVGIFSSPHVSDLNSDGIGDIVLGLGREEFKRCDSAIVALNGLNGEMLWKVSAYDHIYTSAIFKDINGDKTDDVFMAGRSAELLAVDGKSGKVIWRFDKRQKGKKWFNFYNGQFIKDQDGDKMEDILIANGGNVLIAPFEKKGRMPGNILVISGKTGKLLAKAEVPDGSEIYMSIVPHMDPGDKDYKVVFGTGGETLGGHLYLTTLRQIMQGDLSGATILDTSPDKGYIAPPIWIDIDRDGHSDIVANAVEGKLLAFNGATGKPIWSVKMANTEAYSAVAPGYFSGNDNIPDFFVSYAVGQWPDLGWSRQFMVDGRSGKIMFADSLGSYQTSTPVVIDVDGDGVDEAIININTQTLDALSRPSFQNILAIVDFKQNEVLQLGESFPGSNISSTPWLGDLDNDGKVDIVYCHGTNVRKTYSFTGMQIHRVRTQLPVAGIRWGAYMGSRYDGVFKPR